MSEFVGAQPFFNDAVAGAAVQVKADAGFIHALHLVNTTDQPAYLQIFDLLAASVTLGTTVPKWVVRLAANESLTLPLHRPLALGKMGSANAGISFAGTTSAGGSAPATISVSALYE